MKANNIILNFSVFLAYFYLLFSTRKKYIRSYRLLLWSYKDSEISGQNYQREGLVSQEGIRFIREEKQKKSTKLIE